MRDKQEYVGEKGIMEPGEDELPDLIATDLRGYFELLVLRYASQLYAFALPWIGNPTDAEDIVQGAFERAFITLDNYPAALIRSMNLRPWLYKVTLNISRSYSSRTRLHTVSLALVEDVDQLEQDATWLVRAAAVQAIGMLGEQAPIEPLKLALHDEDEAVRAAAARALGLMGARVSMETLL